MKTSVTHPNLDIIHKQYYLDGQEIDQNQRTLKAKEQHDTLEEEKRRIDFDQQFARDWQNLERQKKKRQQQEMFNWCDGKVQEKQRIQEIRKNDDLDFAKNRFKFFDAWADKPLPQHKNFLSSSIHPEFNRQRYKEYNNYYGSYNPLHKSLEEKNVLG